MKTTWKELLVVTAAMALAPMAGFADDKAAGGPGGGDKPKAERSFDGGKGDWEEMKKMSPEDREKFMQERKAKWDALSTQEKVKMIEERRAERRKQRDAEWSAMSDEEKVKHVEDKMKRMEEFHKRGGKRGGGEGGFGGGPGGGEEGGFGGKHGHKGPRGGGDDMPPPPPGGGAGGPGGEE